MKLLRVSLQRLSSRSISLSRIHSSDTDTDSSYCDQRQPRHHLLRRLKFPIQHNLAFSTKMPLFSQQDQFKVVVEGNIGSGKSTLLSFFKDSPEVEVHPEPISQWTNAGGYNALEQLYSDPDRWSFSFNSLVLESRARVQVATQHRPVRLLERSLYSTRYCFVQNDTDSGTISSFEAALLDKQFQFLCERSDMSVDLIVYLRASPMQCFRRVQDRARAEEKTVPLAYLERLHELHEEWLISGTRFCAPCPVLILDADKDLSAMKILYEEQRSEILCGCC